MSNISVLSPKRLTPWTALFCLVLLAFALAACGDGGTTTTTSGTTPSAAKVSTITITEQTGGNDIYAFSPTTLSVKVGDSVKWVNNSDEDHLLASAPASAFTTSSIVPRSGSNDNTYSVTFTTAGTYTITSMLVNRLKDGQHTPDPADSKATLTVTVTN